MSQENIDRLRHAFDVFNQRGEIVVDHLAPEFEMHQASSIIDTAGVFHGPNGLREALEELQGSFEDLRFEPEELLEAPDGEILAVIRVRGRGRGSLMEIDNRIAWVVSVRGDLATRVVVYEEPDDALEAVGLRE